MVYLPLRQLHRHGPSVRTYRNVGYLHQLFDNPFLMSRGIFSARLYSRLARRLIKRLFKNDIPCDIDASRAAFYSVGNDREHILCRILLDTYGQCGYLEFRKYVCEAGL